MAKVVLFCHSLRSDWNHGNAHFLRGVLSELQRRGFGIRAFEPEEARFLRLAFRRFTNEDVLNLLRARGVMVHTRPDGRVFPDSGRADDVKGLSFERSTPRQTLARDPHVPRRAVVVVHTRQHSRPLGSTLKATRATCSSRWSVGATTRTWFWEAFGRSTKYEM